MVCVILTDITTLVLICVLHLQLADLLHYI